MNIFRFFVCCLKLLNSTFSVFFFFFFFFFSVYCCKNTVARPPASPLSDECQVFLGEVQLIEAEVERFKSHPKLQGFNWGKGTFLKLWGGWIRLKMFFLPGGGGWYLFGNIFVH